MPPLFSLERLFAFLDDMWVVIAPDRVGPENTAIREALWEHSRIQVHVGTTKVWNSGGMRPVACDMLERIARENNPDNREVRVWAWRWSQQRTRDQCVGNSFGPTFRRFLRNTESSWEGPLLSDLQSSGRANYQLRSVRPELVAEFAAGHDQEMWQCLQTILNIPEESTALTRAITSLPLSWGGLGLRSATRTSPQCMVGQLG